MVMNVLCRKLLLNLILLTFSSIAESHHLQNSRRCGRIGESPAQRLPASSGTLFQPIISNNAIETNLKKMVAISFVGLVCLMPCHALASDSFTGYQYTQSSTRSDSFQESSKTSIGAADTGLFLKSVAADGTLIVADLSGTEDNILTNQASKSGVPMEGGIEKFLIPTETQINTDAKNYKLCYAPTTRKISDIFLTDISTVYTTEKVKSESESEIDKTNTEKSGEEVNKIIEENADSDDRNNIESVSSHLFISNSLIGSHWISIQGKYEKISEILCRVTWKNIWLDNSSQKNGPSGILEKEKHENPDLVQFIGSKLAFPNSSKFPDLYSVYSPCLFR
jgi:hypothetical protein